MCVRSAAPLALVCIISGPMSAWASTPAPPPTPEAPAAKVIGGFSTPESVLHHVDEDVYLVSNINGSPVAKDDNGFISKLAPDGTIIALKFIDGAEDDITLNAPKGSCIVAGGLYVADIDVVRVFSLSTGAAAGEIPIAGATFLNDIACGDGKVFVSDSGLTFSETGPTPTGTDAIYAIDPTSKEVAIITQNPDLPRPNGLVFDGGLRVVYFGAGRMDTMAMDGSSSATVSFPKGALDGVVSAGGAFYVSSWEGAAIYKVGADGAVSEFKGGLNSPADIGLDAKRGVLLVPHFTEDTVELIPVR